MQLQITTVNMVQEGCLAITDTFMEKKIKTSRPGCPWESGKASSPWLVEVTYVTGWEAWMRECPMGRLEGLVMPTPDAS